MIINDDSIQWLMNQFYIMNGTIFMIIINPIIVDGTINPWSTNNHN